MADVSKQLKHAIFSLKNNNTSLAIQICDLVLTTAPMQPDAWHIKALAAKTKGDLGLAEFCFKQSLHASPQQAAVLSNYANLLVSKGQFNEASNYFDKSTRLAKHNIDAWLNWAILLSRIELYKSAIEKLNHALTIAPEDQRLFVVLGNAYRHTDELDHALAAYNQALKVSPNDIQALHNKGITLRLLHQAKSAIQCYLKLLDMNQKYPELFFNLGCAHYDLNDNQQASLYLKQAIEIKPDYIEAHEALNKLYWESHNMECFLQSYTECLSNFPLSIPLRYSYVAMLIMAQRNQEAKIALELAINEIGPVHTFLHALSVLKNKDNDKDHEVLELLKRAADQQPANTRYQIDIANWHIHSLSYNTAIEHLDRALGTAPLNQEIWAFKGICWRLLDDEKASWLNDYSNFIQAELLEAPDGYDNLEHFMSVLRQELDNMHRSKHQPLDQSVKGGTQTMGHLLSEPRKVIKDFRAVLEKRITTFLRSLPKDPKHPFLNRNTQQFRFPGSWSVKLQEGGFHTNHVHPDGWLSCCTYIEVPRDIKPDDPQKAGWLKFGESALNLEDNESIGREICPQEGLCVLFPSYFWHGTNHFESAQHRMTISCDVSPC